MSFEDNSEEERPRPLWPVVASLVVMAAFALWVAR